MATATQEGAERALERLRAKQARQDEEARLTLICVGEMCLNYKRLAFARWLYKTGRINDNG